MICPERGQCDTIVVMGVCGAGKTTVGALLAERLGAPFVEADRLHSPENVAKMAAGTPLTDHDRWPWLDAVGAEARRRAGDKGVVVACSALRRRYRERLAEVLRKPRFVHLHGGKDLLSARMAARRDHFMPASLLDSQLATLELPDAEENAISFDVGPPPEAIVARILEALAQS